MRRPEPDGDASRASGRTMQASTWITMVLIIGFVWGGFAFALVTAARKESGKES